LLAYWQIQYVNSNDVSESMGEQTKTETGLKYQLVQKVVKKQTNYLTDYQQAEILKGTLGHVRAHTLECLGDKYILMDLEFDPHYPDKFNREEHRTPASLVFQPLLSSSNYGCYDYSTAGFYLNKNIVLISWRILQELMSGFIIK